ncbi:MAG: hypothetical protein AAF944_18190 [Bacteroidota bacterium]
MSIFLLYWGDMLMRYQSFIYLVFNDTRIVGLENPLEEQQFISKITFLEQL